MKSTILVVVDDLIFLSKIQQTARLTGVRVEAVDPNKIHERAGDADVCAVILDLNHRTGTALDVLRAIKSKPETSRVPVLGFVSHVQTDLANAARAAGCDQVLARSTFSAQLPAILADLANAEAREGAAAEKPAPEQG